jgi:hypothetical protein
MSLAKSGLHDKTTSRFFDCFLVRFYFFNLFYQRIECYIYVTAASRRSLDEQA